MDQESSRRVIMEAIILIRKWLLSSATTWEVAVVEYNNIVSKIAGVIINKFID